MAKDKTPPPPPPPPPAATTCFIDEAILRKYSTEKSGEIEVTIKFADQLGIPGRYRR